MLCTIEDDINKPLSLFNKNKATMASTSTLLALPAELRNQIYEHVFGDDINEPKAINPSIVCCRLLRNDTIAQRKERVKSALKLAWEAWQAQNALALTMEPPRHWNLRRLLRQLETVA